jgi:hypothetical protein
VPVRMAVRAWPVSRALRPSCRLRPLALVAHFDHAGRESAGRITRFMAQLRYILLILSRLNVHAPFGMAGASGLENVRCVGGNPMFRTQASASRWELGSVWPERFFEKSC